MFDIIGSADSTEACSYVKCSYRDFAKVVKALRRDPLFFFYTYPGVVGSSALPAQPRRIQVSSS